MLLGAFVTLLVSLSVGAAAEDPDELRRRAEQGDVAAQFALAGAFKEGRGGTKDYRVA